jgi:hypothetical protein
VLRCCNFKPFYRSYVTGIFSTDYTVSSLPERFLYMPKRVVTCHAMSWRKLHNDELHSLYSSPNIVRVIISRRMRWARHAAHMGEGRGVYRVLVGRPEGKRPLGRPRCRLEDNIKMELRDQWGKLD